LSTSSHEKTTTAEGISLVSSSSCPMLNDRTPFGVHAKTLSGAGQLDLCSRHASWSAAATARAGARGRRRGWTTAAAVSWRTKGVSGSGDVTDEEWRGSEGAMASGAVMSRRGRRRARRTTRRPRQ
jgi:hypothetical protein